MTFERTEDMDLVREILTDPKCWRRMANDQAPLIEEFSPKPRPDLVYVLARAGDRVLALFVLKSLDGMAAEVHFCFHPTSWGGTADVALAFVEWVWDNTSIEELRGPVPGYNSLALKLAKSAGFRETSRALNRISKRGKLYDRILLEAIRPENYRREAGALHDQTPNSRNLPDRA